MTHPAVQHLTVRVPEKLRDADGVRLDAMFAAEGMVLIRELPRVGTPPGHVDLLVEDTSAPGDVRGRVVKLVYDEIDGELSFDRWEPWAGETTPRGQVEGLRSPAVATGPEQLSDEELEAIIAARRAARETAASA